MSRLLLWRTPVLDPPSLPSRPSRPSRPSPRSLCCDVSMSPRVDVVFYYFERLRLCALCDVTFCFVNNNKCIFPKYVFLNVILYYHLFFLFL